MKAKKAPVTDYKRIDELFSVSFNSPLNKEAQPVTDDDVRYAAYTDDGTMTSAIYLPKFEMNFDNNTVKMAGIGGVSTLPSFRRAGGIRECFKAIFADIYEEGIDFSYLYPFSCEYYMKFGYGNANSIKAYTLLTDYLPKNDLFKKTTLLDQTSQEYCLDIINAVNKRCSKRYNGWIENEEETQKWVSKEDPYTNLVFTFVYKCDVSDSLGYIRFTLSKDENGLLINCNRILYTDNESLLGLLSLVKTYSSDYKRVRFSLPDCESVERVLKERSFGAMEISLYNGGMVRVVNVMNVLKKARYLGSGEITIAVNDPDIFDNTANYKISFKAGKADAVDKLEYAPARADISMSIAAFSTAVFGAVCTHELDCFDDVEMNADMELIGKIFYKKPVFVNEDF